MESEDQQIEDLKQWWKDNGRSIVLGVVLGIGGVSGWVGWKHYSETQAEAASLRYSRLVNTAALSNHTEVVQQANELIAEYPDHAYASLAAMVAARSAYQSSDPDTAVRLLRWSVEHAPEPEIAHIARIRLARVLGEKADFDAALGALDAIDDDAFAALEAETRGDVLLARGDAEAARDAYQKVLAVEDLSAQDRQRIEDKLDHLATQGS